MTIEQLTNFFGLMTIINFGLLAFCTITIMVMKEKVTALHSKLFGVDENFLKQDYFRFLGNYKLFTIIFNLVPYLALRLIT